MLLAYAVILLAGSTAVAVLLHAPAPVVPVLLGAILGAVLGGISIVCAMLPGEMQVHASGGAGEAERIVRAYFVASNHMITAMGNGALRYVPVGSRWLRWEENSVTVSPCNGVTLLVRGPMLGLGRLRKVLQGSRAGRPRADTGADAGADAGTTASA